MKTSGENKKKFVITIGVILILIVSAILIISFASVQGAMKLIFISVVALSILILGGAFYLAKRNPTTKKIKRGILSTLLLLGLIVIVVINGALANFSFVVNTFLTNYSVDETELIEAEEQARNITELVSDEGIILLENKNRTLPLSNDANVNVFGQASVKIVYGGSGSGAGDESENITLQEGLINSGFKINDQLTEFYEDNKPEEIEQNNFALVGGDFSLHEPSLPTELLENAKEFSEVALITLARSGGEGGDLPIDTSDYGGSSEKHYLELSDDEIEMIQSVKSMNFEKIIVVINSSNAMELGFLEDENIDAALMIGGPGSTGLNSLGKVLTGEVNPSGRLTDTYAYDVTSSPAYYNAGDFQYLNTDYILYDKMLGRENHIPHTFVNYEEGIYVGYRFYETRYVDNITGQMDEEAYQEAVQYPFGYGLSYTDFSQKVINYSTTDDKIVMDVEIQNTGDKPGKEVVQLYYTAPYSIGGMEKSHVVLGDFGKTSLLEPGETEVVTLELNVEDMASYDYQNEEAYVLDSGIYEIKLMKNSHDIIDTKTYDVANAKIYKDGEKRSSDLTSATNQFDEAAGDLSFVSRSDWEGTLPTERTVNKEASSELIAAIEDVSVQDTQEESDIEFNNYDLKLEDLKGVDYSDSKWQQLLEQLSVKDMAELIGNGGYITPELKSIDKPATMDPDGPAGLNHILKGINGVQFPSAVLIGSTWNVDLIEEVGKVFGEELTVNGVSGVYAPAVNIHRTPFSGRNFEYYSEDSLLSGKIASAFVKGANSKGVYSYIKHFALNDQETNRKNLVVWSNEQAIREVYLKAFEIPVKEGGATAIMSSFNRIGTTWAGAHKGLMTNVLRNEWGFEGMVVTDMDQWGYMNVDQAIRAGNDLMLSPLGDEPTNLSTETNAGKQAMRKASHNILYTVANSNVFDLKQPFPMWLLLVSLFNIVVIGLIALGYYILLRKAPQKK